MQRRMDDRGGWRVFKAQTRGRVHPTCSIRFFKLKGERLKSMGLKDVFRRPGSAVIFQVAVHRRWLSRAALCFVLHALDVGGEIAAVGGCTFNGKHHLRVRRALQQDDRQLSARAISCIISLSGSMLQGVDLSMTFRRRRRVFQTPVVRSRNLAPRHVIRLTLKGGLPQSVLMAALPRSRQSIKNKPVFLDQAPARQAGEGGRAGRRALSA